MTATARRVLVTGGTGVLGRAVVSELAARGHRVRVLSRQASPVVPTGVEAVIGDLTGGGAGLESAVREVDAMVHCASAVRRHHRVDVLGSRALLSAAAAAGSPHVVFPSIVGCDELGLGYYRSKTLAELAVAESGLPWTVLRTTRFHDLVLALAYALSWLPVTPAVAGVRDQPIDTVAVAGTISDLVDVGPSGRVPDIGGPEVLSMRHLIGIVQRAVGRRRRIVRIPVPERLLGGLRVGRHMVPDSCGGGRTFDQFVADHVHSDDEGVRVDLAYRWRR